MLGIIIVNWNTRELLERCIRHIQGLGIRVPFRIVVVDNASSDGSRDFLQNKFLGEKILLKENAGFGKACNEAARKTACDACLFLNTDAFPEKGSIDRLYSALMSCKDAVLVSPQLVNEDGTLQRTAVRFPAAFRLPFMRKYVFLERARPISGAAADPAPAGEADAVTGACMMVRRDVFLSIGCFDEDYFFFLEETDFCLRARELGCRVVVVKDARCVHLKGKSTEKNVLKYRTVFLSSKFLFYKKHIPDFLFGNFLRVQVAALAVKVFGYWVMNLLTFFSQKKLLFKLKLYGDFLKKRSWKDSEKEFRSIFRGDRRYQFLQDPDKRGFLREDIFADAALYFPIEKSMRVQGHVIKDTASATTGVLKIGDMPVNIKIFRKKRTPGIRPQHPEAAFYGAQLLRGLGIPVPEILGYFLFEKTGGSGCLLTRHDYELNVLNFVFDDIKRHCGSERENSRMKKKLFSSLAGLLRKLHGSKVIHRDLKASNILVRARWEQKEDPFELFLIDFENIAVDPFLRKRLMAKNLAQLNKSFTDLTVVTLRDRIYFLKKYLLIEDLDAESRKLIQRINRMTGKMIKRKNMAFTSSNNEDHK